MENETIINIFYNEATEGTDWIKRTPRQKVREEKQKEKTIKQRKIENTTQISLQGYMDEIDSLARKAESIKDSDKRFEIKKEIEKKLSILNVNYVNSQYKEKITNYIKQVKNFLNGKPTNNDSFAGKTKRGNEIQKELSELERSTRRKDLKTEEKMKMKAKLLALQEEMTKNTTLFSKFDSIPIRLNQIDNYLQRLES